VNTSQSTSEPRWLVPTDSAALAECRTLKLSELLDRCEELDATLGRSDLSPASDEYKRAQIMRRAAHTVIARGEYRKVQP
jgi:hypothetical protein